MASLIDGVYTPGYTDPVTGQSIYQAPGAAWPTNPGSAQPEDDPYGIYGPDLEPAPATGFPGAGETIYPDYPQPGATALPPAVPPASPVIAVTAVITGAWLIARFGSTLAGIMIAGLRGVVGAGMMVRWASIPRWIQILLVGVGIAAGTDFVLDVANLGPEQPGGGLTPLIPGPGEFSGSVGQQMDGATVVKAWTANGTPFVRLSNGKNGAMKRDGSWKFWTPKKPTVIFAGGASDLRTLLKADGIVDKQIKRLKKVINRRHPTRRRSQCSTCGRVACICK